MKLRLGYVAAVLIGFSVTACSVSVKEDGKERTRVSVGLDIKDKEVGSYGNRYAGAIKTKSGDTIVVQSEIWTVEPYIGEPVEERQSLVTFTFGDAKLSLAATGTLKREYCGDDDSADEDRICATFFPLYSGERPESVVSYYERHRAFVQAIKYQRSPIVDTEVPHLLLHLRRDGDGFHGSLYASTSSSNAVKEWYGDLDLVPAYFESSTQRNSEEQVVGQWFNFFRGSFTLR